MIEVHARVASIEGDHALVAVAEGGCGRCHEPGGCGGKNLSQMFCASPKEYRVRNDRGAKVGEMVIVVVDEGVLRRSVLVAYGAPLVGLFAGAGLGLAFAGDIGAMAGAGAGLVLAWSGQQLLTRNSGDDGDHCPRIK